MFKTSYAKPAQKRYGYSSRDKQFSVVKEVLHNNYQSHNLIGPYHFFENKHKKFDFVHQTISRQEAHAGGAQD